MKIGLVVPGGVSSVPEDGEILCLHWLIERLGRGHDVHVFSIHGAPRPAYRLLGATVHHCGARPIRLRTLGAIAAEHRRGRFDVLQGFWASPPGVIAAVAGQMLRRPVVVHIGGTELVTLPDIDTGGLRTWRGRRSVGLALSGASRITAASVPIIEALRVRGHAGHLVPLGVDLQRWPPVPPRRRQPGARVRLMHVADLNPVKDQPTLLEAARRLAHRGVDFQLDVAGRDTLEGTIQRMAHTLGLGDRVRFHGRLPHDRLYPLVAQADVLWHSSRHESGPLVVLEAAVVGVPTVGTAVGHVVDWAPDAAVAVSVRDSEALARETAQLLENEPRRTALAREAQRRALARDADWTAARFEGLYEEITRP